MNYNLVLCVLALILLVILPATAQPATGVGAGIFLTGGQTDLGFSWSLALTRAPSVPLIADGLLAGKSYGVGVATPVTTLTTPLFRALGLTPSESFQHVLEAVEVGGAVLTPNLKGFDWGLYAKVTAFKVGF